MTPAEIQALADELMKHLPDVLPMKHALWAGGLLCSAIATLAGVVGALARKLWANEVERRTAVVNSNDRQRRVIDEQAATIRANTLQVQHLTAVLGKIATKPGGGS